MERKWRALLIVCVASFMLLLDITVVNVALPKIPQEFHGRERGTAFGIWGATIGLAVAIGPLVGGALTEWAGWRWIFFVNLPIGALCILGAIAYLHESRDEEHVGFDLAGFALLTGG